MGRNPGFDDRDIERLLSGKAPNNPSCQTLTEALLELRAAHRQPPAEETARAHLAVIVESAHTLAAAGELSAQSARPSAAGAPSFRRKIMANRLGRIVVRLSVAALGLSLISGGFVLAGGHLPLPGQASEKAEEATAEAAARAEARGDVGAAQSPAFLQALLDYIATTSDEGCVFGQTVAGIASDGKVSSEDPCEKGEGAGAAQGSRTTGDEKSAEGRARAEEAGATGAEKSAEGRARAEQGATTGEEKSSQGKQTASDAQGSGQGSAQGSKQTGEDQSGQGSSTAEDKSGGRSRGPQ